MNSNLMSSTMNSSFMLSSINGCIHARYLPIIYSELRPTEEEQNSREWWQNTFIKEAVDGENYNFAEYWTEVEETICQDVIFVIELINKINEWCVNNTGTKWDWGDNLDYIKLYKMYAYTYVMDKGVDFWMTQQDVFNEELGNILVEEEVQEEDVESVEEEYNGSKDFPPNETDDVCPICFEEYTARKQRDGIRNSEYKSRCPHYCCVDCWISIYNDQNIAKKRCPICRANVTNWLEDNHHSHLGDWGYP